MVLAAGVVLIFQSRINPSDLYKEPSGGPFGKEPSGGALGKEPRLTHHWGLQEATIYFYCLCEYQSGWPLSVYQYLLGAHSLSLYLNINIILYIYIHTYISHDEETPHSSATQQGALTSVFWAEWAIWTKSRLYGRSHKPKTQRTSHSYPAEKITRVIRGVVLDLTCQVLLPE